MNHSAPLKTADSAAFTLVSGRLDSGLLLLCDHASAAIPAELGDLGIDPSARYAHVAWDIGAETITRMIAAHFDCPAVLAGISRLVVDCNRKPGDPSWMPACSCGIEVPGNRDLSADDVRTREERWYRPYHHAASEAVDRMSRSGVLPALAAIHSFTPCLGAGAPARPWDVGVLWNRDDRMAAPVLRALRARGDLCVGDNQPYSAREINHTLDSHAGAVGLPHVSFEIRQDLVADEAGCRRWADMLIKALEPVLSDHRLRRRQVF